ncbi:MAG: TPR end-of-group domain-containing protein [Planctomycetota bacterium]
MRTIASSIFATFLLAATAAPAGQTPERGKVIAEVACTAAPSQTYALYLPSGYTDEQTWPVVFGFSPAGRGTDPVRFLQDAAEAHGYIVIGSNNAKNSPSGPILQAMDALWAEANARYAIHPKRAYATGFSGGARIALAMAIRHQDRFAGVLATGAYYAGNERLPQGSPVCVYGAAGDADFNLFELLRADGDLERRKIRHWIEIFDGPHGWPPAALGREGIEFFQLDAADRDWVTVEAAEKAAWAEKRLRGAEALLAADKPFPALQKLRQTAETFPETPAGATAKARAEALARTPEIQAFRNGRKAFQQAAGKLQRFNPTGKNEAFREALKTLAEEVVNKGPFAAQAQGLLGSVARQMLQAGLVALQKKQYAPAAAHLEVYLSLAPRDATQAYNLACAYAQTGRAEQALALLGHAAKMGFRDVAHMKADPELAPVRALPGFDPLVQATEAAANSPAPQQP